MSRPRSANRTATAGRLGVRLERTTLGPQERMLRGMARKYVWWLTPAEAVARRGLIVTQIMEMGDYDDVLTIERVLGRDALALALQHAEPGRLSARSRNFWHYRLGLTKPGKEPPPMPERFASIGRTRRRR